MTPIYGKLSDIYGRRKLLLVALSIFAVDLGPVRAGNHALATGRSPGRCRASVVRA